MATTVWQLLFGLGIFLYGMFCLENGLRSISANRLKHWLRRFTSTPLSSAASGVAITTLLQSSSMVSLLVLAFASAGIMPLYNGIGVILGANVGTTATGWLVATLGFKLDLEGMAVPLLGIGCLALVVFQKASRRHATAMLVLGLGLLLYGLSLMKSSVADLPQSWDLSQLTGQPAFFYLLAGMLATALIQSSSAIMMLTLTALHAGLIGLPEAAALVIGADIGTTSTTVLGSLGASTIKKRLALSHVMFNLTVDFAAFFLLLPFLPELLNLLSISDPLYSLVAFHSCFNLLGLLCFLPFLKPFSHWIENRFNGKETRGPGISSMPTDVPEAAITAMAKQVQLLWFEGALNNLQHFDLSTQHFISKLNKQQTEGLSLRVSDSWQQCYEQIKDDEDELLQFSLRLQQQPLSPEQSRQLTELRDVTRALIYACKTLKDIHNNLIHLRGSNDQKALELFLQQQHFNRNFYQQVFALMTNLHSADYQQEEIERLKKDNDKHLVGMNHRVYTHLSPESLGETAQQIDDDAQLSTQLNVNREIHHANGSLLQSLNRWQAFITLTDDDPPIAH